MATDGRESEKGLIIFLSCMFSLSPTVMVSTTAVHPRIHCLWLRRNSFELVWLLCQLKPKYIKNAIIHTNALLLLLLSWTIDLFIDPRINY